MNSDTTREFIDLVNTLSYKEKHNTTPLSEIVFFTGAGFSKSWNAKYPTANELFEFDYNIFSDRVADFIEIFNPKSNHVDINFIKNINYYFEMQYEYPVLRSRFIDKQTLKIAQDEIKAHIVNIFKNKYIINYTDKTNINMYWPKKLNKDQVAIVDFFRSLYTQATGDNLFAEGLRYHFISTNYDFIIETILTYVFEEYGEGFVSDLYRGITTRKFSGEDNQYKVIDHILMNALYKINGGFEIFNDEKGEYTIDYRKKTPEELSDNPPIIMLPNIQQNYKNEYFSEVFSKAVRLLYDSRILVIVGSSFTEEDIMLRYLIRHFAEDASDYAKKDIFYIDRAKENVLKEKLDKIFFTCPYNLKTSTFHCYSGKFTEFCKETTPYFIK